MTVRDAQHAVFSLGYSKDELLKNCPKAPEGVEVDPSIRRMKAVMTHPIGDYAVQPRDATFAAHGVTMVRVVFLFLSACDLFVDICFCLHCKGSLHQWRCLHWYVF